MSDDDQPYEPADPGEASRDTVIYVRPDAPEAGRTVAFTPEPATTRVRPPAPPPPPAPPAPPPSFRVTPPRPGNGAAAAVAAASDAPAETPAAVDDVAVGEESAPVAVVQAERAADVAAAGPRPIVAVETDDEHRGRNILISILIVLVVAAIVAAVVIVV
jgi:hypothetical protein